MNAFLAIAQQVANAPTEEAALALLDQLDDPYTRRRALREWRELQAAQVQTIGSPRCRCGRPVPTSSLCGCCCANHDTEINQ